MNTQNEENRRAVMERLDKILAHTGAGAVNEHEQAAAHKLAKKLMEEHGISMAEIQATKKKVDLVVQRVADESLRQNWAKVVAGSLMTYYECRALLRNGCLIFLGVGVDPDVAAKMYAYACGKIKEQARQRVPPGAGGKRARNSFKVGAAFGLKEKLDALKDDRLRAQNALVVLKAITVDDYLRENYGRSRNHKISIRHYDAEQYQAGKSYGRRLKVHQELGGG